MIPQLKLLINNADDGQANALTLMPSTLKNMLKEMEGMVHSSGDIIAKEMPGGRPGFTLSFRAGGELFYIVQNGELKAGYIPYKDEPNAPGL